MSAIFHTIYDQADQGPPPWAPQTLEQLRARLGAALSRVYTNDQLAAVLDDPHTMAPHCFDFSESAGSYRLLIVLMQLSHPPDSPQGGGFYFRLNMNVRPAGPLSCRCSICINNLPAVLQRLATALGLRPGVPIHHQTTDDGCFSASFNWNLPAAPKQAAPAEPELRYQRIYLN